MDYKEYAIENKEPVNLKNLEVNFIPGKDYESAHKNTIVVCADVLIYHQGGYLLVQRNNVPAIGELWPIGGRLQRGISAEEGIRRKAKSECGLELDNLNLINVGRTSFETDPFNHGKGTDTLNLMYVANGKGKIILDQLHSEPTLVTEDVFEKIKSGLHPYVVDFIKIALSENR